MQTNRFIKVSNKKSLAFTRQISLASTFLHSKITQSFKLKYLFLSVLLFVFFSCEIHHIKNFKTGFVRNMNFNHFFCRRYPYDSKFQPINLGNLEIILRPRNNFPTICCKSAMDISSKIQIFFEKIFWSRNCNHYSKLFVQACKYGNSSSAISIAPFSKFILKQT